MTACGPDPFYIPVLRINDVPETGTAGVALTITGKVDPDFASNTDIVWSIEEAGNTGAVLSEKTLTTLTDGEVKIKAKVANGKAEGRDFTQIFSIIFARGVPVYTVSFETNGGSAVGSQYVQEEQKASRPVDPVKTNFGFVGWYSDSDLSLLYNFDTPVTNNITLYAKWSDPCTVTFDSNGGSVVVDKIVGEGGKLTRPDDPIKNGFVFDNWYIDSEFTTLYDFNVPVTGNFTLYAKWIEIIANIAITVTSPAKGQTPNTAAAGTGNYTIGAVSWSPNNNPFLSGTVYTASVTLTANSGYKFTNGVTAVINGNAAAVSNNTGAAVTLSYTFAATLDKAIESMSINTQPAKLAYVHGDTLDLSGLVVRLTYDDSSTENVTFIGNNKNITANPAHGTKLIRSDSGGIAVHNGKPVVISAGSINANTNNLTVNRAAITTVNFPTAGAINSGAALSTSTLTGGSTELGSFAWQNPSTVPASPGVYPVEFTPADTFNYDYSGTANWNGTKVVRNVDITLTPVASDYTFSNLTQTVNSVTAVTITPNSGKSSGARTIYYEGTGGTTYTKSTNIPQAVGSYAVTFDAAAVTGWNAATGLSAGTLTVNNPVTYTIRNIFDWNAAIAAIKAASSTGSYILDIDDDHSHPYGIGVAGGPTVTFGTTSTGNLTVVLVGSGKLYLTSQGRMFEIHKNQTLIIDSPNLTLEGLKNGQNGMAQDNNSQLVSVYTGALELKNGKITGNTCGGGGGVTVSSGGAFTMSGGEISGNTANYTMGGGGVYVYDTGSSFTMSGGKITGNTASSSGGGGVSVDNNSSFTMSGGEIYGNNGSAGGGVLVGGTFTMSGGEISGNTASSGSSGGGVYVTGSFTMSDGKISGNTVSSGGSRGGGVYVAGGTFRMITGIVYGSNEDDPTLRNTASSGAALFHSSGGITQYGRLNGSTWVNLGSLSDTNNTIKVLNGVLQP